jgi:hypothetical protein
MWGRGTALVVGMILLSTGCGGGRVRTGESAERQTAAILSHRDTPADHRWPELTGPLRLFVLAGPRGLRDTGRDPRPSPRPGRPVRLPPRPGPMEPSAVPMPIVTGTTWSPAPVP